nr:uncharacterized protein CTRU02_09475 [Colletotrichum truncatum]KAF6788666.1 hypothetical protein CTRU02_09475 [Colletotrichum truncatum]
MTPPSPCFGSSARKPWPQFDEIGESSRVGEDRGLTPSPTPNHNQSLRGGLRHRHSRFIEEIDGPRRGSGTTMIGIEIWDSRSTLSTVNRRSHDGTAVRGNCSVTRGGRGGLRRPGQQPPPVLRSTRHGGHEDEIGRGNEWDMEVEDGSQTDDRSQRRIKRFVGDFVAMVRKVVGKKKKRKDKGKGKEVESDDGDCCQRRRQHSSSSTFTEVPEAWWTA